MYTDLCEGVETLDTDRDNVNVFPDAGDSTYWGLMRGIVSVGLSCCVTPSPCPYRTLGC